MSQVSPLYTKTQVGDFNLLVTVSQNVINANFSKLYKDGVIQKAVDMVVGDSKDPDSTIKGTIAAPTVSLSGTNGGTSLLFLLHFTSGTFMWYSGPVHNPTQNTKDISGWIVAFDVTIDKQNIDKLPPDLQAKVKGLNSFSISQLFVDFTTAQLDNFDSTLSVLPNLDAAGVKSLGSCIAEYLAQIEKSNTGQGILGYSITIPKNPDASIPPTDSKFQIVPYYDANQKVVPNSGNSLLVWCDVTQKRNLPISALPWSANMIVPDDPSTNACMFICKADFFDTFMMQNLTTYHRMILTTLNDTFAYLVEEGNPKQPIAWYLTESNPIPDKASQLAWDKAHPWVFQEGSKPARYLMTMPRMYWSREVNDNNDTLSIETNITNILTCGAPGTNAVTITTNATTVRTDVSAGHRGGPSTTYIDTITVSPTYTLTLIPENGALSVNPAVSENAIKCDCSQGGIAGWFTSDGQLHNTALSNQFTQQVSQNPDLKNFLTDLSTLMNTKNKFVFAGEMDFSFKSASFNAECDLVSTLFFNTA